MNVYHYRYILVTPSTDDVYPAVADWFQENIIDNAIAFQSDGLVHRQIEIKNLTNQLDIYSRTIDVAGLVDVDAGGNMPSYVSYGFILRRETAATRNGSKRFSGIPDIGVNGNTPGLTGSALTNMEAGLAADIVLGILATFEPVILRKPILSTDPPTEYASIGSAQMRPVMSTQNTRKAKT